MYHRTWNWRSQINQAISCQKETLCRPGSHCPCVALRAKAKISLRVCDMFNCAATHILISKRLDQDEITCTHAEIYILSCSYQITEITPHKIFVHVNPNRGEDLKHRTNELTLPHRAWFYFSVISYYLFNHYDAMIQSISVACQQSCRPSFCKVRLCLYYLFFPWQSVSKNWEHSLPEDVKTSIDVVIDNNKGSNQQQTLIQGY